MNDNLKNTIFAHYKKTRKGKINKIVKERYLRSDLECGSLHKSILKEEQLYKLISESNHKSALLVDTNICLHEIDVLEYKFTNKIPIIILQTVLQELKSLNVSSYKRIRSLIEDENSLFIIYANEHSVYTALQRGEKEIINDYNDRLIRKSVSYYTQEMAEVESSMKSNFGISVVLITNDVDNKVSIDV